MLTKEQQAVINSNSKEILINACAGSGKTTTLYNFAESRQDEKILYLAFNRSMKEEAEQRFKNLRNTEVRTIHSLAYRNVGYKYKDKLTFKYKAYQLAMDLGYDFNKSSDIALVSEVRRQFNEFLRSRAKSIDEFLSGRSIDPSYSPKEILELLNKIFELKKDLNNDIQITHNFYLKLFHLSNPDLSRYYDLILLDEAQDINEVIIDIFKKQNITKVAVGDSNQQIYAWNGAVDALNKLEGDDYLLTNSFRIGLNLANICNLILKDFGKANMTIKGKNKSQRIGEVDRKKQYAKLCRTRAMVFDNAVENILADNRIYFEGGVNSYNFDTFTQAWLFSEGKETNDPLLAPFDDYEQLLQYVENTEDLELEFLTKIVKKYGEKIPKYVRQIKKLAVNDKDKADIIISTLHRAKGLEYQQLVLETLSMQSFVNIIHRLK
ncbi:UvrD-helicase domain-containing protein [Fuchsiella alkaliacetigena]|uniref:UvrD-helicase domain-containing protein n=1 Tax=Fuchsiella alkaliacetigena TaxID=957042 RepID=UPI00200A3ED8|nr:UvrD-helicase domain-containing protein [Fuchsiella alkaliacetigena]MCK8825978.1 AAA family ATPase [Fuchsiella alkaliacetigena]